MGNALMKKRISGIARLVMLLIASIFLASCTSNKMLSAAFDETAAVVRKWGEACIAGNMSKASQYLSYTLVEHPQACTYLATHPDRNGLKVAGVEDEGSLINSGELTMIVENKSTGKRALFDIQLSNSERGPLILNARCHYSCNDNMWFTPVTYFQQPDSVARAEVWVDDGVSYSQTATHDGYRTDCSGFISYAWGLESNGNPVSPNTTALGNNYAFDISFSELRPGDIINNKRGGNQGHAVIFVEWLNKEQTKFVAYEENGHYEKAVRTELSLVNSNGAYTIAEYDAIAPGPYYAQRSKLYS